MKNIEALIADGGDITLGAIHPIECAATAAEGHNCVAMLVRREGETLKALPSGLIKPSPSSIPMGKPSTKSTATDSIAVGVKMTCPNAYVESGVK